MFGSEVLEIGIGVIFLFLFVSLIATALREGIEAWFKTRAADLERGIVELLNDPNTVQKFYSHPLISSLYGGQYESSKKEGRLPSYIPSTNFSSTLIDLVARGELTGRPPEEIQQVRATARADAQGILAAPVPGAQQPSPRTTEEIESLLKIAELRATADLIEHPKLKQAVLALLDETSNDIAKLKQSFEVWFDGTMDRVSGWYKRRTQYVLFGIGFGASILFNIDAFTVIQRLSQDKSLRAVAVAQAERITTSSGAPGTATAIPENVQNMKLKELEQQIRSIGYPIGWSPRPQHSGWPMVLMPFGWLITALAVMLGAPFWFDILNKFMVIRSTVKPREKSPEEGSEDRQV